LYEITGRKGDNDKFSDESGDSPDEEFMDKESPIKARNGLLRRLTKKGGDEQESNNAYSLN
jgi:hypothetical protein